MTWAVMKIGKEKIYLDFQDLISLISRGDNATDVYTAMFPDGITVDHPLEDVIATHFELMTNAEEDSDEGDDGEDGECADDGAGPDGGLRDGSGVGGESDGGDGNDAGGGGESSLRLVQKPDG